MTIYMSGSLVRSTATFTDDTGSPADPDAVTFKWKQGAGDTQTDSSPTKDGTGVYHHDLDTTGWAGPDNQPWTLQWSGTGAVQAIGTDSFDVSPPAL